MAARRKNQGSDRMIFRNYLDDIKEKTQDMSIKEKVAYVITYYWYHILIIVSIIALIFFTVRFYLFGNVRPEFTCVIADHVMNEETAEQIAGDFADMAGLDPELVEIDPDYFFSYGDVEMEGVNESSYEKFFLRWRNQELDAVIIPESLYRFCEEMGGSCRSLEDMDTTGLETYTDNGVCTAVVLGEADMIEEVTGKEEEKLLLAFPDNGRHEELCEVFLRCIADMQIK